MDRRKALQNITLLVGAGALAGTMALPGCKSAPKKAEDLSQEDTIAFMDEIAETIIPKTDTPGAKEAAVGAFMAVMVQDTYTKEDQQRFIDGLNKINQASENEFKKEFMNLTAEQRTALLTKIDKEAGEYNTNREEGSPPHYFTYFKDLTVLGYFTSEPGATKALRYVSVPGRFEGCIDYKQGDKAWAL